MAELTLKRGTAPRPNLLGDSQYSNEIFSLGALLVAGGPAWLSGDAAPPWSSQRKGPPWPERLLIKLDWVAWKSSKGTWAGKMSNE